MTAFIRTHNDVPTTDSSFPTTAPRALGSPKERFPKAALALRVLFARRAIQGLLITTTKNIHKYYLVTTFLHALKNTTY